MNIVLVEWEDSVALGEVWVNTEESLELDTCKCVSAGIKLYEDSGKIILSQSLGTGKNNGNNLMAIPRGCIKRMRTLKVG